jgi:hypothetical protein
MTIKSLHAVVLIKQSEVTEPSTAVRIPSVSLFGLFADLLTCINCHRS